MERLQEIKITVEINTNKSTYKEVFEDFETAKEYYDDIMESL